jgi:predicted TIM-barrel fold metal-dependent hydrolase
MNHSNRSEEPLSILQYRPQAQARVPVTEVFQAKYPAIDAHNHFVSGLDVERVVEHMDACNIRTFVDLSGGNGDQLKRRLDMLKGRHPARFAVFFVPDFKRIGERCFSESVVCELEQAAGLGVQGVKVYKELGLSVRDKDGTLVHVNDPRLWPIWQTAGELGLPVLMHIADPWAYFAPLDERNERYIQLYRDPARHFYGADYPSLQQLLEERDEVIERHPATQFIGAHIGSQAEDLAAAAAVLNRYPNYTVDFSARVAELGRKPRQAREFCIKYQDRILFGTDGLDDPGMYRSYFRFLETADECMEYYMYPNHGFFTISGIDLPDEVLRKVYAANACRIIPHLR